MSGKIYGPQSKLFLSCDLTGSTAFKQRPKNGDGAPPWQKVFLQFYREFPQQLFAQRKDYGCSIDFELWKAVGDELIFTCDVSAETDICDAVSVWVRTLSAYKEDNLQHEGQSGLGVKGGVFLGTFPGPDHESTIPRSPDSESSGRDVVVLNREALLTADREVEKYIFDFFGPSIDTGFRVLSRCSSRYLTLSVEVALALALMDRTPWGSGGPGGEYTFPNLLLLESMELKGVWGGRSYPIFALDLEADDPVNAATKKFLPSTATQDDIKQLCEACYDSSGWPFRMYLPESKLGRFGEVPTDPLADYLDRAPDPAEGGEEMAPDFQNPVEVPEDKLPTRPTG
ncbi:hypothetical protein G6020_00795 [Dietzia sp. B19]|uniref:hypothetical protein n=1 Tax=Dietzia sp. B19 TaxID=1630632 RepID=UPI0015FB8779|nr:hypothetical protein [Dietzia sp. B19]MBB1055965.1 hypothetical protein [Dietzia sp. B19]